MNRRIFLGSLFTAALIPEAIAGRGVHHQIPTKKSQPTPQRNAHTAGSRIAHNGANHKDNHRATDHKGSHRTVHNATDHNSSHRTAQKQVPQTPSPVARAPETTLGRAYYLSLLHTHTEEALEIAYRIGGEYQRSALRRLNYFLRDYRTDEVAFIDPRLYDMLYLIQQRTGNPDGTFEIVSAYRSIETNEELRRYSSHVARNSFHLSGQALDIRLQRTSTRAVRNAALDLERGGVGYYPASDFVHIDTGDVRHWAV